MTDWLYVPFKSIKEKILEEKELKSRDFRDGENTLIDVFGRSPINEFSEKQFEHMDTTEYYRYIDDFKTEFTRIYELLRLNEISQDPFADIRFSFRLYDAWDNDLDRVKLVSYEEAHHKYREYKYMLDSLMMNIESLGLQEAVTDRRTSTYMEEWIRMHRLFHMSFVNLVVNHIMAMDRSASSMQRHTFEGCTEMLNFMDKDLFKKRNRHSQSPFRVLFNSCLKIIQRQKLIRRGTAFLRQKYVHDPSTQRPHGTCYYEQYQEIKSFMANLQSTGDEKEMFELYWGKGNIRSLVENCLMLSKDANLIDYSVMHGVVSFRSHLYYAKEDKWWYHWDPKKPKNLIAIAYINDELDTREIQKSIMELARHPKTNELNPIISLFRTQGYNDEEIETAAAIFGRILQPFKADKRELFIFLKGLAGTGKSSVIELLASFYDQHLIANMSNKQEETFGLDGFQGKCLIIASDLTDKSTMDSGDILNLISGDLMTIRIKNKPQQFDRLNAHFIGAGNQVPAKWIDVGGNFRRRVFPVDFKSLPVPPDPTFKYRLINSGGSSYRFLNCAYMRLSKEMPAGDIWSHLPERFLANRDEFLAETSALRAWIYHLEKYQLIKYSPELYWKYDDFEQQFKAWAIQRQREYKEECKQDRILPLLSERNCKLLNNERRVWPLMSDSGKEITGEWILGLMMLKADENVRREKAPGLGKRSHESDAGQGPAPGPGASPSNKRVRMENGVGEIQEMNDEVNQGPLLFNCSICDRDYDCDFGVYFTCEECPHMKICQECEKTETGKILLKHPLEHTLIRHNAEI